MNGADIQFRIECEDHANEKEQYLRDFAIKIQSYTDEALTENLEFFQGGANHWINHPVDDSAKSWFGCNTDWETKGRLINASSNMSNHADLIKAEINRRAKQ